MASTMDPAERRRRRQLAVEKLAKMLGKDSASIDVSDTSSGDETEAANALFRRDLLRVIREPRIAEAMVGDLGEEFWSNTCAREPRSARRKGAPIDPRPSFFASGVTNAGELLAELAEEGFGVVSAPEFGRTSGGGDGGFVNMAAESVEAVVSRGWPAVFCFMVEAPWRVLEGAAWASAAAVLGEDCVLEPTVYAWHVAPGAPPREQKDTVVHHAEHANVHANFPIPHRDYSFSEAHFSHELPSTVERARGSFELGEEPSLLCAWIPLTDASTTSGCLNFLPKEFDAGWRDGEEGGGDHLRAATIQKASGAASAPVVELRFDLSGARAAPVAAGDIVLWHGSTIHWGGKCSKRSTRSRISLGCTFRSAKAQDGACFTGGTCLPRPNSEGVIEEVEIESRQGLSYTAAEETPLHRTIWPPPLSARIVLVLRSILLYARWFELEPGLFPPTFHSALRHALAE